MKIFLFLLTGISPSSPDITRSQGDKTVDIHFYGDDHDNLQPLKSVKYRLVRDDLSYVGVNVSGILRPMFDREGNMVTISTSDMKNYLMLPEIAKKYRFTLPPWQLKIQKANADAGKQQVDAQPSDAAKQPQANAQTFGPARQPQADAQTLAPARQPQANAQPFSAARPWQRQPNPNRQNQRKADSRSFTSAKQWHQHANAQSSTSAKQWHQYANSQSSTLARQKQRQANTFSFSSARQRQQQGNTESSASARQPHRKT